MQFNTIDEAKEYVVSLTNKARTIENIDSAISYYQEMVDSSHSEDLKKLWLSELDKLSELKNSDDFKNGNYPQGIDDLILELVEWRSIIYAFQNVDTQREPFKESGFYAQWYLGGIYGVFSIFGKLLSKDKRDNSLRKLWETISPIMLGEGACTKPEVDCINAALDVKSGRFTNENSQALLFRNKLISHNEAMPVVKWDEVDKDFAFLIRMWSLLVSWSSFGLFQPFRTDDQAFLGVEPMFERSEISNLKAKRQEYLKMVEKWSKSFVHTGEVDPGRGAFSTLSVKVSIVSEDEKA
ncbi:MULTISPECIES: hypothetical protein [Shewanella]|uniref:Uncharacterized protein n=1 Tax=Shewanella xiamenensis TaxID=332186 RepID=A0AAE4Q2B0_9GAMM|nr:MULTISPECIES: hypothetical protein [Shewanella]MCT8872685.1 hypothetical protein [Shewanella xiamenensis]MDV5391670.1 hypothetical protein [Shewanella xiamenensis]PWH02125.1 hypothetical protein DIY08_14530 [Shewanella xiamenensis]TVL23728.1 hypothetical protein AYI90_02035 [Shewanella xiamenensis]TVL24292.1 hypothetical protein AYI91_02035 [Shewanella xiamenensis]